jgi:hypothetical protein
MKKLFLKYLLVFVFGAAIQAKPLVGSRDPTTERIQKTGSIDRYALVTRHKIVVNKSDKKGALQVGNGEFVFSVDITGLQTFYGSTLSQWGWHSSPLPKGEKIEDYKWQDWDHAGRKVPYMTVSPNQKALEEWLYYNPHRLPLGRLMMLLTKSDGKPAKLEDLTNIHQELDLWTGVITSHFKLDGQPDTYEKHNYGHPSLIGTYGMLPGDGVDPDFAKRTVLKVAQTWKWNQTWGWDFPMMAMSAAKVGERQLAVDMLLYPTYGFQFNNCGLVTGGPFPYFPSNGGLLYAVALMAAGWDGAPNIPNPGFPQDGSWVVKWEGLKKAL